MMEIRTQAVMAAPETVEITALEMAALETAKVAATAATTAPEIMIVAATMDRVEDSKGWYPISRWEKIDGKWYYFDGTGYMESSCYRDGYWLGSDGALVDGYFGEWKSDATGWWFEDSSGWYPTSTWLKINGCWFYFESDGYIATSKYIDGYWLGSDGVCQ